MATRGGAQTLVPAGEFICWSWSGGGIRWGAPHWPGTPWGGDIPKLRSPWWSCGSLGRWGGLGCRDQHLQGPQHLPPQEMGHTRRRGPQGGLKVETGPEEMLQGPLQVGMGPAPPCTTTTLGRDFLIRPLYFPIASHLIFPLGRAAGGRDKPAPSCRQGLFKLPNKVLWVLAG